VRGLPRGMPPPWAATAGGRAPARRLIYTIETTKAASAGFYFRSDILSQNSSNFEQKKIDGEPPLCYNEVTTQSL
jgi:hypothetical protein